MNTDYRDLHISVLGVRGFIQVKPKKLVGEVAFHHLGVDELLLLLFSQQQLCCGVCRRRIKLHLAKEIKD